LLSGKEASSARKKFVELVHGAGGSLMQEFIKDVIINHLERRKVDGGIGLDELDDGASIPLGSYDIVFTIDSHTVEPLFFPGGDIGKLAVCGTVNDLAVMGAEPIALASSITVAEGFEIARLEQIVKSMNEACKEAGVSVICGDTKVMPRGSLSDVVVTTAGIGLVKRGMLITDSGLRPGDVIVISGSIGNHGAAILSLREGLEFETSIASDVAPLNKMISEALKVGGVTAMKDPTRGGVAMALNELASKSGVSLWIEEEKVPVKDEVKALCEVLGIDVYELTCEGRVVMGVRPDKAEEVLEVLRKHPYGREAEIVGEARKERPGYVFLRTVIGGTRVLNPPLGEPVPRIC